MLEELALTRFRTIFLRTYSTTCSNFKSKKAQNSKNLRLNGRTSFEFQTFMTIKS